MFERLKDTIKFGLLPVIGSFVFASLVILTFRILFLDIDSTGSTLSESIILTIVQFITMGFTVVLYFQTSDRLRSFIYKVDFSVRCIIVSLTVVFFLFVANFLVALSSYLIGVETAENTVTSGSGDSDDVLYLFLIPVMIFLVAPVEEYLFRGILQGAVREVYSKKIAIISSGVVFGIFHVVALVSANLLSLLFPLLGLCLIGILLGYVYERYQNMLIVVIAHGVYNSTLLLITFLVS